MARLDVMHRFHDRHAGATDLVFGRADTGGGRSSYDRLVEVVPAGRVLDLACGDGPLLERLADRAHGALTGLDANPTELEAARRRLAGRDVALVLGVAQALPFPDGAFDAVASHMALMLMDEPEVVLAEIARVLRPGGTLAFVVGRDADTVPVEIPVWRWLMAAWRDEGVNLGIGDARWRVADGVRGLLDGAFRDVALVPMDAHRTVPADEMATFLERAYYSVDALSPEGKQRLRDFVEAEAPDVEGRRAWPWRFELALGTATRR